jgi:hypothetical protein
MNGIVVAAGSSPSLVRTGALSSDASTWMYRKPRSAAISAVVILALICLS